MHVEEVDERDSSWENGESRFRVYSFESPGMATATYDLTGTDVEEAIRWAENAAGADLLFSIALVHDEVLREAGRRTGVCLDPRHRRQRREPDSARGSSSR